MKKNQIVFLFIILNLIFYGCASRQLPILPVTYESPKLEITKAEIKKKQEDEERNKEKLRCVLAIETVQALLKESSTLQVIKYSNEKLKESKKYLEEASALLDQENFIQILDFVDRARQGINKAVEESKIKAEEDKKKDEDAKKRKEILETQKKAEEARKIREKNLAADMIKNSKSKTERIVTPEMNRYLPQSIERINVLLNKAEKALLNEDYKTIKNSVDEIDNLTQNLEIELKKTLDKINGDAFFADIKKTVEVKNFGEAYFKLRKFIRDYSDSKYIPEGYFLTGICFEEFDNFDRAKEMFQFVINNYPNTEWAFQSKDHLDIDLKSKFLKKAAQEKANEEQIIIEAPSEKPKEEPVKKVEPPKNKEAANKIYKEALDLLLKEKQVEKAREKLEMVIISPPNESLLDNALYWMGETYYSQQDFEKAMEYFQKAIINSIKSNKDAAAQFKIGLSLYNMKKFNEASEAFKVLTEKYPDNELNRQALKYIGIIEKK